MPTKFSHDVTIILLIRNLRIPIQHFGSTTFEIFPILGSFCKELVSNHLFYEYVFQNILHYVPKTYYVIGKSVIILCISAEIWVCSKSHFLVKYEKLSFISLGKITIYTISQDCFWAFFSTSWSSIFMSFMFLSSLWHTLIQLWMFLSSFSLPNLG